MRPEPRSWERTSRHVLASAGTSFGTPVVGAVAWSTIGAGPFVVVFFGSAAFVLGAVTIVWGLVAWAVRERRY